MNAFMMVPRIEALQLIRLAVNDCVEQCYAVGFGPQAHHSSFVKRLIFDLEQIPAVVKCREMAAFEFDAQAEPLAGRHGSIDPIAALAADDIKRSSNPLDGLVKHDIVLQ